MATDVVGRRLHVGDFAVFASNAGDLLFGRVESVDTVEMDDVTMRLNGIAVLLRVVDTSRRVMWLDPVVGRQIIERSK